MEQDNKNKQKSEQEVKKAISPNQEEFAEVKNDELPPDGLPFEKETKEGWQLKMALMEERQNEQLTNPKPQEKKKMHIRKDASELMVISRARDLVRYVISATRKIPKSERYSFAVKVQGLALDMIECLVRANLIVLKPKKIERYKKRYEFQEQAMGDLKVLEYLVAIAVEENIMLLKQFQQIAKQGTEVGILLTKWMESDRKRYLGNA